MKWLVEGDISKLSDTIDHNILQSLLEKRIHDRAFLDLYRKAVQCTYVDLARSSIERGIVGTPQGGTMSPMLSNIMLHELDQ